MLRFDVAKRFPIREKLRERIGKHWKFWIVMSQIDNRGIIDISARIKSKTIPIAMPVKYCAVAPQVAPFQPKGFDNQVVLGIGSRISWKNPCRWLETNSSPNEIVPIKNFVDSF